jgi:hypothetical protein
VRMRADAGAQESAKATAEAKGEETLNAISDLSTAIERG